MSTFEGLRRRVRMIGYRIGRFADDVRGMAAIEAGFIFPVMVTLYVGLVDITNLVTVNRRVTITASTIADLTTQIDTTTTTDDLDGIFDAARAIFEPLPTTNISLSLFTFRLVNDNPTLQWKYNNGHVCGATPAASEAMQNLMADGNDIVVARVCYDQQPLIGSFLGSAPIQLEDEILLRPRQSSTLTCTDCPTS